MDYERIHKPYAPQGGGFSPRRLRAKLLGVEARLKEDADSIGDELSLGFEATANDGRPAEKESDSRSRDHPIRESRFSGQELVRRCSSGFEFQRSARAPPHRPSPVTPSKWDDARKWIPNPIAGGRGMAKVVLGVEEEGEETKRVDKEIAGFAVSYSIMENAVADMDVIFSESATTKVSPSPKSGSVSMRDMGTEMTPLPSQEPSRTATPVTATSPLCSPASSQHLNITQTAAAAWEEAEKAKYLAGFRREEVKIQAWENHQKEKIQAEMRKTEVKIERVRANAHERMMKELAAARHRAERMRAAAEAKRSQQAANASQRAEHIRRTGGIPPPSCCCCWSCCS